LGIIKRKLNNFVQTLLGVNRSRRPNDFVENLIEQKKQEIQRRKNVIQKK
jgi:hypothetical protein